MSCEEAKQIVLLYGLNSDGGTPIAWFPYDRNDVPQSQRSQEWFPYDRKSGFHMIATIAMIAAIVATAIVAIIWKPGLCERGGDARRKI